MHNKNKSDNVQYKNALPSKICVAHIFRKEGEFGSIKAL